MLEDAVAVSGDRLAELDAVAHSLLLRESGLLSAVAEKIILGKT
jgi:hypothetical protein